MSHVPGFIDAPTLGSITSRSITTSIPLLGEDRESDGNRAYRLTSNRLQGLGVCGSRASREWGSYVPYTIMYTKPILRKETTIFQSSWNETAKLNKLMGFFLFLSSRSRHVAGSWSSYWRGWRELSKFTNHWVIPGAVFTGMRYFKKSMLTCSTYLSLLSSPVVFAQLFSMRFPYYLGAWIHGTDYFMWSWDGTLM